MFTENSSIVQVHIDQQAAVQWWVDAAAASRFSQRFRFIATAASVHAGWSSSAQLSL